MYSYLRRVTIVFVITLVGIFIGTTSISAEEGQNDEEVNPGKVTPGIETLLDDHLDWIEDKRVGLITNPTGVTSDLDSSIDVLYDHPDVNLTALYGPEHGIRGDREAGEHVDSYTDAETDLPVHSLYGSTWKPTEEMLEDVDVLLYDIQDIDSNVYTYIYNLGFAMEAAAEQDKQLIILDRPNPNGGTKVEGPVRSEEAVTDMGRFLLPVRHGMTPGELAMMWNNEYSLGANIKVSEMKGWERSMAFEDTDLPWVMTSPNIPTEDSAHLYAGTELLSDTNLADGTGTTRPFELVGAPWVDAEDLAADMNKLELAGVTFRPAHFTPTSGEYEGEVTSGVQIHLDDPSKIDQVELGLHLIDEMRDQDPDKFEMTDNTSIGDPKVANMIKDGEPVDDIIASWQDELDTWKKDVRNPYLIYSSSPDDTISTKDIQEVVTDLEEKDEIMDNDAVHDLNLHLKAVGQYEKKDEDKKVVKHMENFIKLVNSQKEDNLISSKAQEELQQKANALLTQANTKPSGVMGITPFDISAAPGEERDLKVIGYNEDGEKLNIPENEVEWDVDNNIGYIENGKFYAENDGQAVITAKYDNYKASREVDVSTTFIEDVRYSSQSDYTRIVLDLSKTNNNYELNEDDDNLEIRIPYGKIDGDLDKDGDKINIKDSPVLSSLEYSVENGEFIAVLNLKQDGVEYDTPEFSSRLVVDLQHE